MRLEAVSSHFAASASVRSAARADRIHSRAFGSHSPTAASSRARLLAAVGECDPNAREWIRSARAAERTDALAAKCEETASSLKRARPAAAAAREAAARLRRRG